MEVGQSEDHEGETRPGGFLNHVDITAFSPLTHQKR